MRDANLLTIISDTLHHRFRPLPTSPDDQYDEEISPDRHVRSSSEHSAFTNAIRRTRSMKAKGLPKLNMKVIDAFINQSLHPEAVDDRKGAFASGLDILSTLPPDWKLAQDMSKTAVAVLYNTVPHPPAAYLGAAHSFRAADGGGNNLQDVDYGRAGRPYARSVQSQHCVPPTSLPDPGLIFETLLKRSQPENHPSGISSFTFAFATLVTHSVFRTNLRDWSQNETSSYLDLSPLYGHNQKAQDMVRDKSTGRGLLYPDTFSEERMAFLPPAASAILVLLSRNHNYIADRLLKLNERGLWENPPPPDPKRSTDQDEEIFQTARLVNCGHFMSLILGDYAASFLGLSTGQFWDIKAFDPIKTKDQTIVPRGQGNHVSVEFNMLYRWHATLSQRDVEWTEEQFNQMFPGKAYDQITMPDFLRGVAKKAGTLEQDPKKRTFGGLTRQGDGRFSDDDLARILLDATETPGGAWRARGTPPVLKIVEVLGIEQARHWGVCTMNEFRKFLSLKPFETFEEWNRNKEVADAARRLYGHIDNLELYPGLQAEDTMPVSRGSYIAAGFTTTRAVLGDAIAMIRGDRYYTTDFTPANLTAWGYADTLRDYENGGFGAEMPKLLMRTLPRHYPFNNAYSLFPFFTPDTMKENLAKRGPTSRYNFLRPEAIAPPVVLTTFEAITYVIDHDVLFKSSYETDEPRHPGLLLSLMSIPKPSVHDTDLSAPIQGLFSSEEFLDKYQGWYRRHIKRNIMRKSWTYDNVPGRYVDVVNDVINAVVVEWAAGKLCGIRLKTKEHSRGLFTKREVYDKLSTVYSFIFLSLDDTERRFALRSAAHQICERLYDLVTKAITRASPSSSPNVLLSLASTFASVIAPNPKHSKDLLKKLAKSKKPLNELVTGVVRLALCTSVNYAHAAVLVVDFYLDDERKKEREKIVELIDRSDEKSSDLLHGYVREAMRLNSECAGLYRDVDGDAEIPQGDEKPPIRVGKGERIWASFKKAHMNEVDFPNPEIIDPTRSKSLYHLTPTVFHNCSGISDLAEIFVTEIVREVFALKNVRRAAGNAGRLAKFTTELNETERNVYITPSGATSPFPGPMHIVYDP